MAPSGNMVPPEISVIWCCHLFDKYMYFYLCTCTGSNTMEGRKEGRKEHIYLTKRQCTIHIYQNRMVRRLSLRLSIVASARATEIIII